MDYLGMDTCTSHTHIHTAHTCTYHIHGHTHAYTCTYHIHTYIPHTCTHHTGTNTQCIMNDLIFPQLC